MSDGDDVRAPARPLRDAGDGRSTDARDVVIVGFGSHSGSVIAGDSWGAPMERMPLPPARPGSVEALRRDAVPGAGALFLVPAPPDRLSRELPSRAVRVVHRPRAERPSGG